MKFHVWCPDRGEDESCACEVEALSARSAVLVAAERDYWHAEDPFDEIILHCRQAGDLFGKIPPSAASRFVVDVVPRPVFEVRFMDKVP